MPGGWNHNVHYHRTVLEAMPDSSRDALDVGCGDGELARALALRCEQVTGIDLNPTAQRADDRNVTFVVGDVLVDGFPPASFDFISAVATLHHLPLEAGLTRLRELLRPGGVLAIIGLYRPATLVDRLNAAFALPVSLLLRRVLGTSRMESAMQTPEQTLGEIRIASRAILPGAVVRRRFLFRYTLVWRKP